MFAIAGGAAVFGDVVVGAELHLNVDRWVVEQLDHLGAGEEHGAVAVEGVNTGGAVVIINLVAREGGADAGVFDLAFGVDARGDAVPARLGRWSRRWWG